MRRSRHLEKAADKSANIRVEVLQGEWADALVALHGFRAAADVRPLAKLLLRGPPVPKEATTVLGQLLDPPWGTKGPRLELKNPVRWDKVKAIREIGEKRKLRAEMLVEYEKLKSQKLVIANFVRKTKRSPAYLRKCWALDNRNTVIELETILNKGVGARATRMRSLA
jgi:hypothetical protein